jgi:hypothetical protein
MSTISPTHRQLVLAIANAAEHRLDRCPGGFKARETGATVFTKRAVNAANREWLVDVDGPFAEHVTLTTKGEQLAREIRGADQAQAGAA